MMQPGQFITLAEETGQIIALGAWVLRRATVDIVRLRRAAAAPPRPRRAHGLPFDEDRPAGRRDLSVSVNVSARQFADARLRRRACGRPSPRRGSNRRRSCSS